jgi:uncharacterized protein with beta-barrel porin domain
MNKMISCRFLAALLFWMLIPVTGFAADWPWDGWYSWQADLDQNGGVVTYSIDRTGGFLIDNDPGMFLTSIGMEAGFSATVPNWETLVHQAFDQWASATGITFLEVADSGVDSATPGAQGAIRITAYVVPEPILFSAYAYYPPTTGRTESDKNDSLYGDVFFAANMKGWDEEWFALTIIHELGHALGLAHPAAIFSPDPPSVMSYADVILTALTDYDRANIQAIYLPAEETGTVYSGGRLAGDSGSIALEDRTPQDPGQLILEGSIRTAGNRSPGIKGTAGLLSNPGFVFDGWNIDLTADATIQTDGAYAFGIAAGSGNTITHGGSITTSGQFADGIMVLGGDNLVVTEGGSRIATSGVMSAGIAFRNSASKSNQAVFNGDIETRGWGSEGIYLYDQSDTTLYLGGTVSTLAPYSPGIYAKQSNTTLTVDGIIATLGEESSGIRATGGRAVVDIRGTVATGGAYSPGILLTTDQNRLTISGQVRSATSAAVELLPGTNTADSRLYLCGTARIEGDIKASGEGHTAGVIIGGTYDDTTDAWVAAPDSAVTIQGAFTGSAWNGRLAAGQVTINGDANQFSLFTVEPGAALLGNTVFTGDLENYGRISPGNSIGQITISGDYTQQGILEMEVARSLADTLEVGGNILFLPGAGIGSIPLEPLPAGRYTLLTAGGTIAGLPDAPLDTLILDYGLDLSGDGVDLTVSRSSYASLGMTSNGRETGAALDNLVDTASGDLARAMVSLDTTTDAAALNSGLDQIAPSEYGALQVPVLALGYRAIAFAGQGMASSSRSASAPWQVFSQALHLRGRQDAADGLPGFRWQESGVGLAIGRDFGRVTAGLSLVMAKSSLDGSDHRFHARSDAALGGVYAATSVSDWRFDVGAGLGRFWHDTERRVIMGSVNARLGADPETDIFYAHLGGSRLFSLPGDFRLNLQIGLDGALLHQDAFEEDGGTLAAKINDMSTGDARFSVGTGISRTVATWHGASFLPFAHLGWVRQLKTADQDLTTSLLDESFHLNGYNTAQDRFQAGLGLNVLLKDTMQISLAFNREFEQGASLTDISLSCSKAF